MSQPGWESRTREFLRSYWTPAGRRAFWNLAWVVVCTGVSQVAGFGVMVILTHGLSQEAYGTVLFAVNLGVYLSLLGTLCLGTIVIRDLAQRPDAVEEVTGSFLAVVSVASAATGLITAAAAATLAGSADERVMLWCVAAGNTIGCLGLTAFYDAAHRQGLATALSVPADLAALGVLYGLWSDGRLSVPAVGLTILGKAALTLVLQTAAYHRFVRPIRPVVAADRVRKLVRSAYPMLVATVLYAVPLSGGVLLARALAGEEVTAVYGLAVQWVSMQMLVVSLVFRILQPHMMGPHGTAPRFLRQLLVVLGAGFLALSAGTLVVGWVLLHHILPPDYRAAFDSLLILQAYVACCAGAIVVNTYLLRLNLESWLKAVHAFATAGFLAAVYFGGARSGVGFAACASASAALLLGSGAAGLWWARFRPAPELTGRSGSYTATGVVPESQSRGG